MLCIEGRDGFDTVLVLSFTFLPWGLATSWRVWRETAKENSPLAEDCKLTFAFWAKNIVQWCAWTDVACPVIPLSISYVILWVILVCLSMLKLPRRLRTPLPSVLVSLGRTFNSQDVWRKTSWFAWQWQQSPRSMKCSKVLPRAM